MPGERQSEQHPSVSLDTGIYLTTSDLRFLLYFIIRHPLFHLWLLDLAISFHQGSHWWLRTVRQKVKSAHRHMHLIICCLMAFTIQSIFSPTTITLPHTRQCHLKTRNTVFSTYNTHLRGCKCQFLLHRLSYVRWIFLSWVHSRSFSYGSELALHGYMK